jgi:aspartate kinase
VASARRGVTDHLLGLVAEVREAGGPRRRPSRAALTAADRAVTSGELVAASLLAVALEQIGVPAAVLDAREAGLHSDGKAGEATLTRIRPARVERLLGHGVTPVVTGFQGWHRGRHTALGRGGSDITAVALAGALRAQACELVKDPGALHTADPRMVPGARPIAAAGYRFVTELAFAGARVIHHAAAETAERERIPLRFASLDLDGAPETRVGELRTPDEARAVVLAPGHRGLPSAEGDPGEVATVSVVFGAAGTDLEQDQLTVAAGRAGTTVLRAARRPHAVSFLVHAAAGATLLQNLHAALDIAAESGDGGWMSYASHR